MLRITVTIGMFFILLPAVAVAMESKVAYLAFTEGYWQAWVMSSEGGKQMQITTSDHDKSHISWYPDGDHILVNGNQGELSKVNVITKNNEVIKLPIKGPVDASVSSDGKDIVFSLSVADSRDNNHLWLVDDQGKNLTKLTNMNGLQHEPVWSPDDRWIYFLSGGGKDSHDIWRYSLKAKTTEQLTAGQFYHFDVAVYWNDKIAFSNNRTGNYEIWVRDKNKETQITHHDALDARPTWSADGKQIIFESSRSGVVNIWRINLDDGKPAQLTHNKQGARFPVWWYQRSTGNVEK